MKREGLRWRTRRPTTWMPNGVQEPLSALNGDNDKSFKERRQEADAWEKERFTLLIGPIGCFHYCPCVSSLTNIHSKNNIIIQYCLPVLQNSK